VVRGWPRVTISGPEHEHQWLSDLVSDLRNAVAHFNVEFISGADREISAVTVWTQDSDAKGRPLKGSRRWVGRITVEELDRLARLIADVYLKEFASAA
jgi:hypothetical protein